MKVPVEFASNLTEMTHASPGIFSLSLSRTASHRGLIISHLPRWPEPRRVPLPTAALKRTGFPSWTDVSNFNRFRWATTRPSVEFSWRPFNTSTKWPMTKHFQETPFNLWVCVKECLILSSKPNLSRLHSARLSNDHPQQFSQEAARRIHLLRASILPIPHMADGIESSLSCMPWWRSKLADVRSSA